MEENIAVEKKFNKAIVVISILIPLAVAVLFSVRLKDFGIQTEPLSFLPPIYATINGITAIVLIVAVNAIRKGNRKLHQTLMTTAIVLSVLFLVMYIAYHMTAEATKFGSDSVAVRYIYFFILISHIILSIVIIPLVLISYVRALAQNFDRHRRIARIAYPIWLYVAITGVVVYLMISPYYAH